MNDTLRVTDVGLELTDADWLNLERLEYQESLYEFFKAAWPILHPATLLVDGWHLRSLCAYLEAVTRGEIDRLAISIPPGYCKSVLVSVIWPAWEWTHSPHLTFVTTSSSEAFCERDAGKMRIIINSEWYQKRWPLSFPNTDTVLRFVNHKMGERVAKSYLSLTGIRADRLILDDVLPVDAANSDGEREKVIRRFFEQSSSRGPGERGAIVIIAQRIHERDLIGEIQKRQDDGIDLGFTLVTIPMEFEGERYISDNDNDIVPDGLRRDPRSTIGELILPAYQGRTWTERQKATMGVYAWSSQYQQNPVPRENGFFKVEDIKQYRPDELPKILNYYATSDHALGLSNKADANVVQVWGVDSKKEIWLVDTFREVCSIQKMLGFDRSSGKLVLGRSGVFPFIKQYRPLCWFADSDNMIKSAQATITDAMRESGLICRREIVSQGSQSKDERAAALQGMIENGMVHVPATAMGQSFMAELQAFPSGRWRDQVDAATILPRMTTHAAYMPPADPTRPSGDYTSWDDDAEDTSTSNSF
jgi:hypothetical protein